MWMFGRIWVWVGVWVRACLWMWVWVSGSIWFGIWMFVTIYTGDQLLLVHVVHMPSFFVDMLLVTIWVWMMSLRSCKYV